MNRRRKGIEGKRVIRMEEEGEFKTEEKEEKRRLNGKGREKI